MNGRETVTYLTPFSRPPTLILLSAAGGRHVRQRQGGIRDAAWGSPAGTLAACRPAYCVAYRTVCRVGRTARCPACHATCRPASRVGRTSAENPQGLRSLHRRGTRHACLERDRGRVPVSHVAPNAAPPPGDRAAAAGPRGCARCDPGHLHRHLAGTSA